MSNELANFKAQLNNWGNKGRPFLCLIDFEMQKPRIYALEDIDPQKLLYNIDGIHNETESEKDSATSALEFHKYPQPFTSFEKAFHIVKQGLLHGDSYLVNLTFPTEIKTNLDLKQIYHNSIQPFKLWLKDELVVFSPERFIKIKDGKIHTFPMKGTIDASLPNAAETLLKSKKERAEHATITDLLRNDLSRVANNVKVEKYRYLETIQTLQKDLLQVSSHISGSMEKDWENKIGDILFNLLPAGSISGAPKNKTLEIIRKAELQDRGYYTGIMGVFDGNSFDSAVMIRYIEKKENAVFFRSGGGITSLSNAEEEYQEMVDKVYLPWQTIV